jgi:hypothetical protein
VYQFTRKYRQSQWSWRTGPWINLSCYNNVYTAITSILNRLLSWNKLLVMKCIIFILLQHYLNCNKEHFEQITLRQAHTISWVNLPCLFAMSLLHWLPMLTQQRVPQHPYFSGGSCTSPTAIKKVQNANNYSSFVTLFLRLFYSTHLNSSFKRCFINDKLECL